MSEPVVTEVPVVPTLEQLEAQLNATVMQRAALKDQLEEIEKALPVIFGQVQLLKAQQAAAEATIED